MVDTIDKELSEVWAGTNLLRMGGEQAPKGGVTVQGKKFEGGQFIPGDVVAKATDAEKKAIKGGGGGQADEKTTAIDKAIGFIKKQPQNANLTPTQLDGQLSNHWFNNSKLRDAFGDNRKAFAEAVQAHLKGGDEEAPKKKKELVEGDELSRGDVLSHIMTTNPPVQITNGSMSREEWASKFLSDEPYGYVVADVSPYVLHFPIDPGDEEKVEAFTNRSDQSVPPIVLDSNDKLQARHGGGRLDRAFGLQSHTVVDGKHRVQAARNKNVSTIRAIIPKQLADDLAEKSYHRELWDFAHEYASKKGYTITRASVGPHGPEIQAKTKDGRDRRWSSPSLERIAKNTGHVFEFSKE